MGGDSGVCETNFDDRLNLTIESCCTTLNQGDVRSQAHLVDMPSRIKIIQGVEDECKRLKPLYIKLRVFDVGVMRLELDMRVEFGSALLRDL